MTKELPLPTRKASLRELRIRATCSSLEPPVRKASADRKAVDVVFVTILPMLGGGWTLRK
jgi:hypothetical protein